MNVGQVEFSVTADNLKNVLEQAKQLENVLNRIDKKTVGAMAGAVTKAAKGAATATAKATKDEKAYNKAVQQSLKNEQAKNRYLDKVAKQEIKAGNQRVKEKIAADKRAQKVEKETAKQRQANIDKAREDLHNYINQAQKLYDSQERERQKNAKAAEKQRQADEKAYNRGVQQSIRNKRALDAQTAKENRERQRAESARIKAQSDSLNQQNADMAKFQRGWARQQVNVGAQLQTLGASMQRISAPFVNIYRGITMGIGYRLMYKMLDSIQGAFSRYDTMNTYAKVLNNLGVDATKKFSVAGEQATDVYHNLENAVLGLPTGIDEIIESMRRYAAATGDVERATKLAIAANNAYIAGGMEAREKLFTEKQLKALAAGKKLESNQWASLSRNAPLMMRSIADAMNIEVGAMETALQKGEISGKKFLDVLIKLGTEGSLKNAANEMKQTWDAVFQNAENRMHALGEGILNALNTVFESMDGRSFLQHVLGVDKKGKYIGGGIRGVIDGMSDSVQKWIKSHPEKLTNFFKTLSGIDWKGIVGGFAEFGLMMGKVYATIAKIGGGKLVRTMLGINLLGKAIQIGGGFIKGTAGLTAFLATFIKFKGLQRVAKATKNMASAIAVANGAETIATAALSWQQVVSKGLTIAGIMVVAKSIEIMSRAMQNFGKVKWDANTIGNLGTATLALGGLTKFMTSLGATVGAAINSPLGKYIIGGTAAVEVVMLGIGKTIELMGKGVEGLSSGVDAVGKIATMKLPTAEQVTHVSKAITALAEAFNDNKNPFENLQSTISAWTKGLRAGSITKIAQAMDSIKHLSEVKMSQKAFEKAESNFLQIQRFAIDIADLFSEENKKAYEATSTKGAGAWTPRDTGMNGKQRGKDTYAEWQEKIRGFAEEVKALSTSLSEIDTIMTTVSTLNKHYAKFRKKYGEINEHNQKSINWDSIYGNIQSMANFIYRLAAPEEIGHGKSPLMMLSEVAQNLKGDFGQISSAIGQIPKVIRLFGRIQKAMDESGLFGGEFATPTSLDWDTSIDPMMGIRGVNEAAGINFANRLKPIFSALSEISKLIPNPEDFHGMKSVELSLERIKTVVKKLGELSSMDTSGISIDGIRDVAQKIKDALKEIEEIGEKEINISITVAGEVDDQVSSKITEAKDDIDKAKKEIKDVKKKIKVNISADMHNSAVSAISSARVNIMRAFASIPSSLTKTVHIDINKVNNPGGALNDYGVLNPHRGGKIQYRAKGGTIFATKGTDTVPAMLTPGEWVVNRKASSLIGDNVLWKLNHMDIRGAINSLSTRFGSSNVVNNTYNRNIGGITLNNNNTAGVGLNRASRWVKGL